MAYSKHNIDWEDLMTTFEDGMIFVVDSTTFTDVLKNHLFGLPASYLKEMKILKPGKSALFFFERNAHTISGIFTSTGEAESNINTKIWKHRNGSCKFPAQIPWRSVANLPTLPKSHPKLPRFLRTMKIKGKYLEPARLQELLSGYRNAIYGGSSTASRSLHNPYLTQNPSRHQNRREGEITDQNGHHQRRGSPPEQRDFVHESKVPRRSSYASPEIRPWNDQPPKDFLLDYESHQYNSPASAPQHYGHQARVAAQAAFDEFNRKIANLGFMVNQNVYDEQGMLKSPQPQGSVVRGGYPGAVHRPLYALDHGSPPNEYDDYWHYDDARPLCYWILPCWHGI